MDFLTFDSQKCSLCGKCVECCPFDALHMDRASIQVDDSCRMCGLCVRRCPEGAIRFEQRAGEADKSKWRDFLIFAEQERGEIHPVAYELIGEALKMAAKLGFSVNCVLVGGPGSGEKAKQLLYYGVHRVYVYEHPGFTYFRADCWADAVADCIAATKPSSVLIGATALGRSLAPRLATRFHTGLTADCTALDVKANTDLVQIRPAFGGNIMAQISITHSRPQFATVRYRVMDRAPRLEKPAGEVILCPVTDEMARSRIRVVSGRPLERGRGLEETDIIVVAGRGARDERGVELCRQLAKELGGQLAFTRPMVEGGFGDASRQIGLSGRTVRPRLIITCGVSGAIQFTSCMAGAECIVAIDSNPQAQIFKTAHYCVADDLFEIVPRLTELVRRGKEEERHAVSL